MPLPEIVLWRIIRQKNLGVKFRRQYTIGNRILDFYSPAIRLGIEIDGESHFVNDAIYDREKREDEKLKIQGIKILRFTNFEVMKNIKGVANKILSEISNPHPNPPPQRWGGKKRGADK
ncbi:endonuclease domain-containing protein [Patescibacteria group bacterium]|nr:endonuclease domain-containing protein [Patescibacteria group bacterium]MBU2220129.1 endonuclease domain-containing protein [Patescibacteria group bacterium]